MSKPIHRLVLFSAGVAPAAALLALLLIGTPGPVERPAPYPDPPGPIAEPVVPPDPHRPFAIHLDGDAQLRFQSVIVTGYTSSPHETDSTPFLTASMTRVRPGCLALSRDLLRTFTPGAPFDFGDWVVIPGVGIFIVEDTMNARWKNRADIWFQERRKALRWGRRRAYLARLPWPIEEATGEFALGPNIAQIR